jgi:hypothetical protein
VTSHEDGLSENVGLAAHGGSRGGFVSVRSLPSRQDLDGCDAFLIRVRGDGRRYKFTARTDRTFDSPT